MSQPLRLSLEQEFRLKTFIDEVQKMSRQQAQDCLIDLHSHMILKDKIYQGFINQKWDFEDLSEQP